jgi:hypothetical protein
MEIARSIETSVTIYWATWRHIPEENALRTSVFFCKLRTELMDIIQVGLSCNSSNVNSVDSRFEYQPWHRLSWGFSWCFLIPTSNQRFLAHSHQFIIRFSSYNQMPLITSYWRVTKHTIKKINQFMLPERRDVLSAFRVYGRETSRRWRTHVWLHSLLEPVWLLSTQRLYQFRSPHKSIKRPIQFHDLRRINSTDERDFAEPEFFMSISTKSIRSQSNRPIRSQSNRPKPTIDGWVGRAQSV